MAHSLPVFALRRLFAAAVLAVVVSALTFLTLHGLFPEAFNDTRPLLVECAHFLFATFVHLDLGDSVARPLGSVTELVGRGLAADFSLLIGALAFGIGAGVWGGAVCARHPGTWRARILQVIALLALCAPVYAIGMSAILLFKPGIDAPFPIGILPYHGYIPLTENPLKWLHSLIVPWMVAGAPLAAVCLRMMRSSINEIRGEDFIRTAAAKGLCAGAGHAPPRRPGRHAARRVAGRRLHAVADRQRDPDREGVRRAGRLPADPERARHSATTRSSRAS